MISLRQQMEKIKMQIENIAKKFGYLYNFNPQDYLKSGDEYYRTRKELIELEHKNYIVILEEPTKNDISSELVFITEDIELGEMTIQIKRFKVWDDVIDEEDSSWIDERVVHEINIDAFTTEDEIEYYFRNFEENMILDNDKE